MKIVMVVFLLLTIACKKEDELTGRTSKGELKSPCVSNENGPCSKRFNPNFT